MHYIPWQKKVDCSMYSDLKLSRESMHEPKRPGKGNAEAFSKIGGALWAYKPCVDDKMW